MIRAFQLTAMEQGRDRFGQGSGLTKAEQGINPEGRFGWIGRSGARLDAEPPQMTQVLHRQLTPHLERAPDA